MKTMYYFARLRNDARMVEFCVINPQGEMFVETNAPDGSLQRWEWKDRDGMRVFRPPDGYVDGPIAWVYDKKIPTKALSHENEVRRVWCELRGNASRSGRAATLPG